VPRGRCWIKGGMHARSGREGVKVPGECHLTPVAKAFVGKAGGGQVRRRVGRAGNGETEDGGDGEGVATRFLLTSKELPHRTKPGPQ
jgi:hypothetical protein